jgi:outer membrane protein insertion porin family
MNINDPADPLLPPQRRGRHRSARERQRKGPMFGCLRALLWVIAIGLLILIITGGGAWLYLGSTRFETYVKQSIETTLEGRLGRDVTIGSVTLVRSYPQRIILNDIRIANAPGGKSPYFAVVRQVEITGGIESFRRRSVDVDRIDIRDPRIWFEVFDEGAPLVHNFPKWKTGPKRKREILHVDLNKMYVTGGGFLFLDHRHDIQATITGIGSEMTVTRRENLYAGVMTSPFVRVRIQDYAPIDLKLRGGFRYTPGILALQSIALNGEGIEAFINGKLDPLTEGVYDLRLRSRVALPRIKQIFGVEKTLDGVLALDTTLKGKQGDFVLAGGWVSDEITADVYTLTDARGRMNVTGAGIRLDVERARYGGGTIGAHYELSQYAEPYPMKIDLRYDRISIEKLFSDWGVKDTGLRGAATGSLAYAWNKDKVLAGSGTGTARLAKNATAFSDARYPIPIGGSTDFALDNGVIRFRSGELDTDASHVSFTGTMRIEDLSSDLNLAIRSTDFSELDRIAYNFAHSADKKDFELLGLGGSGTITGTVKGTIKEPQVVAEVHGANIRYNEVLLGDGDIALRYDGPKSTLTFDRAVFTDRGGRLALTGTVTFPDSGPGPRFDIAVEANGYPAQRAVDAMDLKFKIGEGIASGRMIVAGTPESGRVTFAGLVVRRADADLRLNGDVQWMPGEGNVRFDLDIAANNFPVQDVITFLDLGEYPVTGKLTGNLKISGPKQALEGRGSVKVTEGSVFGEPVDTASAEIAFEQGKMRATNVIVQSPAGEIRGEAELDLTTEKFSYTIASSSLDLSRLKLLEGLKDLLGGNITLRSTGAGTFDQPELVVEATLNEATLRGLTLPPGSAPPTLYLAIRNGQLIVRGAIADLVTIEGEGTLGENSAVDAIVRVNITDLARLAQISPKTATIPASGNVVMIVKLGGRLTPIEALTVDAQVPVFNLQIADHAFTAPAPLQVTMRNGRISFDSFALQGPDSTFTVSGYADVIGDKTVALDVRGGVEAALLQLVMTGARAEGHLDIAARITGTLASPRFAGTAELEDAQIKIPGFPQLLDNISGVLRFRGDRIDIESVRATVGGGTVVLGGFIGVEGLKPTTVRVTVQGTDVAIRYYEGLTVEGNFSLLLTGGLERAMLQGDVNVTRAVWFREFDLQQTLLNVILARRGVTPVSTATWQDRLGLRIHLSAPGTLAVRNNLADVTGTAELDVTGTIANPVVLGEVALDEGGKVRIQGVDYTVTRGTIAFQNPFRIDPYFDVTLEGTLQGNVSEIESGPIDVTINLTGTIDRLAPTITSDPPASDITLFSLLGFGGLGGNRPAGASAGPGRAAYGTSLLYQSLFSAIGQRVLPFVDSFAYDPGLLDTGGGAKQRVTFEKRISNRIRFLLVYNLDDQQSKQVVEWLVNRDWTLQLTRDETDEYRLDARFRRRYDAHWTWGERGRGEMAAFGSLGATGEALQQPVAPAPPTTAVQTQAFDDAPIAAVNFRADANVDTSTMGQYVTLRPGQRVTIRELQSSIKNLFSTGNFRDVRVDAARGDAGVTLTFALFLHYRVGDIHFEGLTRRDRTRAERSLQVRTGEVHSFNAVDDTAIEIQQVLNRIGYLEATVDPETTFDRARSLADVTFHVTPGPRAKVADVQLEGTLTPFKREELLERMSRGPGKFFDLGEAREDANRMKNLMIRADHRQADVDFLGHNYDAERDAVTLRYSISSGPKVRVEVEGVPRSAVRRLIPFRRNQEYSEDVVERAAETIVEEYQRRGHYYATVDTEGSLDRATNTWTTTYHVDPGERFRLAGVTFSGNIKMPEKQLQEVVATSTRGGVGKLVATIFRRPSGVTLDQLSDDREAVESYYRLQGFSEATVATPAVTTRNDGTMVVDFPVTEGPQTIVSAVIVEGNEDVPADQLPELQLEPGDPLNPQLLHEDTVALQTFYADRGNVEVQVKERVEVSADKTTATVTQVIAEGPQVKVGDVIVRGNTYTNSEVILRKSDLDKGDAFSYSSILEAQRELYRLGIFQRVDIQPEQAGTTVGDRDVVINVEEGRNLTLTGAVGLRAERGAGTKSSIDPDDEDGDENPFDPRLAIAAAHRNLFGTGRYAGIEVIVGSKEKELFLTYREPFISRWDVPLQVQIYQTDDSTRPGMTVQQRGTSIEATKVARSRTRWSLRYDYRISECKRGDLCLVVNEGDPVAGLDRSLLNIDISSISPTFFWDHRDDILDPHRGFFTSASIEYAFPFISAEANFLKEFVQGAYYLPVSARTVFAFSGRAGLIQPLGETDVDDVPLVERFTAGGETTHRAFPLDLLGNLCRDDADFDENGDCDLTLYQRFNFTEGKFEGPILPIGGSSLLLLNAEYRFPVFGPVGAAVFVDAGTISRKSAIQFDKLRYGVGVGFRYLSPVGPLRLDVGYPLGRRSYEESWQYFITLGYAF